MQRTCVGGHARPREAKGIRHAAREEGEPVASDHEGAAAGAVGRQQLAVLEPHAADEDACFRTPQRLPASHRGHHDGHHAIKLSQIWHGWTCRPLRDTQHPALSTSVTAFHPC